MFELIFKKNRKRYCRYCKEHVPYMSDFDTDEDVLTKPDNGRDTCRKSFTYIKNPVGEWRMALYPKDERCENCGQMTSAAGRIRYEKCEIKNRDLKCKDFTPRWYVKLFFRGK